MTEEKATETPQKEDAYFPKSVKEAVAYLRERGELDEEKWTQLKRKSLQVKLLVIVVAIAASLTAWQLGWGMVAYLPPVIAIVLLIMHHRDEQHKVLCMSLTDPVTILIESDKKEINVGGGGLAINLRYKYKIAEDEYGTFRKIIPSSCINYKETKIYYSPVSHMKHMLLVPQQKSNLLDFNLRR